MDWDRRRLGRRAAPVEGHAEHDDPDQEEEEEEDHGGSQKADRDGNEAEREQRLRGLGREVVIVGDEDRGEVGRGRDDQQGDPGYPSGERRGREPPAGPLDGAQGAAQAGEEPQERHGAQRPEV